MSAQRILIVASVFGLCFAGAAGAATRRHHSHHHRACRHAQRRDCARLHPRPVVSPPATRSDLWVQCNRYATQGVNVETCAKDAAAARAAIDKYRDINRATLDGFVQMTGCESSALGAMGEHWARLDRMIDPTLDVTKPEILLYLPTAKGRVLMGAEYEQTALFGGLPAWGPWQPSGAVSARPSLFGGKAFDGPMAGHAPEQPWHYDLHVYTLVDNPAGLFAPWTSGVRC